MPWIIADGPTTQAAAVQVSSCEWGLVAEGNAAERSTLVVHLGVEGALVRGGAEIAVANGAVAGGAGDEKAGAQANGSKVAGSCILDCAIVLA